MAKQRVLKAMTQFPEYSIDSNGAVYRDGARWDDPKEVGVTLYGSQPRKGRA
jgi:hypothetical protein